MIILWLLLAALAMAFALRFYAVRRLHHVNMIATFQADYADALDVLIEDERTEDDVLRFAYRLGDYMRGPRMAWIILWRLLDGQVRKEAEHPDGLASRGFSMPAPLDKQFTKTVVAAALVIMYRSTMIGWLLRRVAAFGVRKVNKREYAGGEDAAVLLSMKHA